MGSIKVRGVIQTTNVSQSKALMTTQIKVKEILELYRIDADINRDLNYARLPKIMNYIKSIDNEIGIFFPSIVCSFPDNPNEYYDSKEMELTIPNDIKLTVIDGQHRLKSLDQLVLKRELDENTLNEILESELTMQLYFGLSKEDERILFADMNSNSKRVSMSLITSYDAREIMNVLIKDLYNISKPLQSIKVEFNKSRIVRPTNTDFITSVRLKKFVMQLLFGKQNINMKEEQLIKDNYDDILTFLERFFRVFVEVLPEEPGNVLQYVLGLEPMQNAIALYLHQRIIVEKSKGIYWIHDWEEEVKPLEKINWSPKNPLWRQYMLTSRAKTPYEFNLFIEHVDKDLMIIIKEQIN